MLYRFCTYAVLRNLRFFDAFFVLYLAVELGFTYTEIGIVLAYDKLLMGLLEVPLAIVTDRFGRRRSLALSFALASVAFAVFGFAAQSDSSFLMILFAQTVYGVAESLRSGSHKAIVLDWLRHQGQSHKRVKVLGTMRFFSKNSAGIAALMAGGIVWLTGGMNALFFAAIVPTLGVVVLVLGYPRFAEGELRRRMNDGNKPPRQNLREALARPGVWVLVLPSVVFESQIKLIVAYLQPAVAEGTSALDFPVLGTGALLVGVYMAAYGFFAGGASLLSSRVVSWSGGVHLGLRRIHLAVAIVVTIATMTLYFGFPTVGLVTLLAVGALQNSRRPLFVTCLDDVMAPEYRATVLSTESQGRSWLYAGTSIGLGLLTDTFGLVAAFGTMALLLWLVVVVDKRGQVNPA